VQLDFLFNPGPKKQITNDVLQVGDQLFPLNLIRNPRARRYVLRMSKRGEVRVTIPRGGSQKEALNLANKNIAWLEGQWKKHQETKSHDRSWNHGSEILFRGKPTSLVVVEKDSIRLVQFADEELAVDAVIKDIKPAVEHHLWNLARIELPPRVEELAAQHEFKYARLTVRNQSSRWGSCSPTGTISLNWRLIQVPPSVRDYIILHELAHTRFLNHSAKYWREVKRVCPDYRDAERWMKANSGRLLAPA
jgi:predicted metal-dependent hydrolase